MKLKWPERMQKFLPLKAIPFSNYILIVILILGFLLRFYKLNSLPLYGDELTMVYDSYSLLKTGMDQTGERLPLTFKMGAGRPAGYVYGSIPFVALFGPSELGIRGLSLVSGMGMIILMYFLGKKLFETQPEINEKVGLIASFLTSISLWDIYLSRGGFEAHFALFLALFGVVLFFYKKYILAAILFGLTVFTYPTFKLTLPLIFILLTIKVGVTNILKDKNYLKALVVLVLFALISARESYRGISDARFLNINILSVSNDMVTQKVNEQRFLSTLPVVIKPLIYNKPIVYGRILLDNYVENLSPSFLFLRGDRNPRTNPGEWGMFYLVDAVLLVLGLYYLQLNKNKNLLFLIAWIAIVPLATMLLGQTHALRNDFMLPPFLLILAYALINISHRLRMVLIGLILVQLFLVLLDLYYFVPYKFGSFWSEVAKIESLNAIKISKTQKVVLSTKIDNMEYAYPVYAKVNPREVIAQYGKFPKIYGNVTIVDHD